MFLLLIAECNPKMGKQYNSSSEFSFRMGAEVLITNIATAAKGRIIAGLHFSTFLPFHMEGKALLGQEKIKNKN